VPRGAISRDDLMRRLRYIKPATSFRSGYAYDNILYGVAGLLIERVSGQTWEDYMKAHVFAPAGMRDAAADFRTQTSAPNRAQPHGRVGMVRGDGPQVVLDERDQLGRAMAPAGLIAMSANDMARWLQIQLAGGALPEGGRLFSAAAGKEMWSPVTPIPITPAPQPIAATTPTFDAYALGWEVRDYHGTRIVWHAGGLLGFTSIVCLIPEKNVGFAIEVNAEESEPRHGLMYELIDHYLGLPRQDWPQRFRLSRQAHRRCRCGDEAGGGHAGAGWPFAAARSLCRDLQRSLVWQAGGGFGRQGADGQLRAHGRYERAPCPLSVRYVHRPVRRSGDRKGLSHLPARCRRQGIVHFREASLAHRRFQLRLQRPAVHARARTAQVIGQAGSVEPVRDDCGNNL
jgi:hypothetical protein